jgi:monovalent cation/proton antiporter MnhG/PhaG subunit
MIAYFFFICGIFVTVSCFVGIIRVKDYLIKLQAIKISNIYGTSFILIGILVLNFNLSNFIQLLLIMVFNTLTTIVTVHSMAKSGIKNNIRTAALTRKEYDSLYGDKNDANI